MSSNSQIAVKSGVSSLVTLVRLVYNNVLRHITPSRAFKLALVIELGMSLPAIYRRYLKKKSSDPDEILMEPRKMNPQDIQRQSAIDKVKPPHLWNGVAIFFPDHDPQAVGSPTNQLIWFFKQAKFRIQLCIYLSSYPPIENIILQKKREGVLIQVITDHDTSNAHNNFNVSKWKQSGIEVKIRASGYFMHNKFAIIDEQAVLTGSLNWTKQGFTLNRENVLVSTDFRIVEKYMQEYNNIWALCDRQQ